MDQHRTTEPSALLDWSQIDTVLLDMDGTLLDLNYDNTVWNELVPRAYASRANLPLESAREILLDHMAEIRGTIQFYSFEYWSEFTGVDLIRTHHDATELIRYRSGALPFLKWLRATGRHAIIATNADRPSLRVKDMFTDICNEVDAVVSSHDFREPKEAPGFWAQLLEAHPHEPQRALFIDDNVPVLDAAARAGIANLLAIARPDSARAPKTEALKQFGYAWFDDFSEIYVP